VHCGGVGVVARFPRTAGVLIDCVLG
jgi:hypothetical protein